MSDKTGIEWCDATWNPVTGCSKVSEGCRNCYAKSFAERFKGVPGHYFESGFDVTLRPDKLMQPIRWKRDRRIFVNSMSDLFHQEVPQPYIDQVFGIMLASHMLEGVGKHTYMLLTKRPERMREYFSAGPERPLERWSKALDGILIMDDGDVFYSEYISGWPIEEMWPLPNLWLGVSVENQQAADERIPLLLQTPAAIRFLSCEPLLGPVDIWKWHKFNPGDATYGWENQCSVGTPDGMRHCGREPKQHTAGIDWVIVGGESGSKARPMHPWWVQELRDQCQAAGVPFFFKQWGEWRETHALRCNEPGIKGKPWFHFDPDTSVCRIGMQAAGRELDGRKWDEFPGGMAQQ